MVRKFDPSDEHIDTKLAKEGWRLYEKHRKNKSIPKEITDFLRSVTYYLEDGCDD